MAEGSDIDFGTAGASGRREYERRRARREGEVRKRHPRVGNLLLKFQEAPEHEKAWATGALAPSTDRYRQGSTPSARATSTAERIASSCRPWPKWLPQ